MFGETFTKQSWTISGGAVEQVKQHFEDFPAANVVRTSTRPCSDYLKSSHRPLDHEREKRALEQEPQRQNYTILDHYIELEVQSSQPRLVVVS